MVGKAEMNNDYFFNNIAESSGGALYITQSKPNASFTSTHNKFVANIANNGGAIYIANSEY